MFKNYLILLLVCFISPNFVHAVTPLFNQVYYVDAQLGKDNNDGLSETRPWKSLAKINGTKFSPGAEILFKAAQTWVGQLHPQGSGSKTQPIRIGSYGKGKKPHIAGNGIANGAVYLYNQQYWELRNLEITNYNPMEEHGASLKNWEKNNTNAYVLPVLPPQLKNSNVPKYGIYVLAKDLGEVAHIKMINIEVHGVNGYINQADEKSKDNGGIFFKIIGEEIPTYFNEVLIDSCNIHDVDRTGLVICSSTWSQRTLNDPGNWKPSRNIRISNCRFSNTGANALIVRVVEGAIIEHNLFDHCAIKGSGNAAFSFNTDDAIWQFNECRFTKANVDDRDAGGIDSDYKSKRTILQYNFVHDNDYGMLVTGGPANFNDSTVVRYNIFENDGKFAHPSHGKCVIRLGGSTSNTHIYNNIIYLGADQKDTKIVSHEIWKTIPDQTLYQNNIFYNLSQGASYDLGKSTNNIFEGNLYFGNTADLQPADAKKVTADPGFVDPGKADPAGYQLKENSPAVGSGIPVKNNGGRDYFGRPLKPGVLPSRGIYEFSKKAGPELEIYLLLGQSNMAGRGPLSVEYTAMEQPNVLVWDKESKWATARHPLHYDKPKVSGVGPGLSFGFTMARSKQNVRIGLVPCAVGGTNINVWKPGAVDKGTNTHPFDDAEMRIREAMKYGVVKGMIWHQGEANSSAQNMTGYLDKLNELITRIRKMVGDEKLPVVIGELGRYKTNYPQFNKMLARAPQVISDLALATSESLVDKGDLTHFDSPSATAYGKRYAEKMLWLQRNIK
ncbi:sialate O-acetylesterase [Pedobacter heparinus]|uniref:sialate O-acetylesterase n=1 Tax=Pedobacter heparinus TaxID=984 RepID=UPI0029302191|nr:sialate O-acetylesterase [Pedobacter heparinus]